MVSEFVGDDALYLDWIANHSMGYVLNVRMTDDPHYIVLHRATCRLIAVRRELGAYTTRGYRKICATDLNSLHEWSRKHGRPDGSFSKVCGRCDKGHRFDLVVAEARRGFSDMPTLAFNSLLEEAVAEAHQVDGQSD